MRPARALIDLAALRHNYRLARQLHGGRALAVVKANAYGHGAVRCAQALAGEADGFAVAFLEEALELRAAGLQQPILLLEGVFAAEELAEVAHHRLWIVVHHEAQIEMLERTPLAAPVHVWLKINSGMNRAGFLPAAVETVWQRLRASGKVADITLMTHFARSDEFDDAWKLDGVVQDLDALYGVGKVLAGNEQWPNWYEGNAFRAAHDKLMAPAAK